MKKYINYGLCLLTISALYCCSSDDTKPVEEPITEEPTPEPTPETSVAINLASVFAVDRYNVVVIDPQVTIENDNGLVPQYKWTIKITGEDGIVKDSVIGDTKTLHFIAPKADKYIVDFTVTLDKLVQQASTTVTVAETGKVYNSIALSLIDFLPSPGYTIDDYEYTTKAEVFERVQSDLTNGELIPLGTFGGYIVTKFDHTVINTYGKRDFDIQMNTDGGNAKITPVSIYVAYDANKNGVADENEWYEIAGSEYSKSTTVKNYEVTYHKPDPDKEAVAGAADWQFDTDYLKWSDNKNISGTITKTKKWRRYNYYPQWLGDSYTMRGTKVNLPVKDVSDGQALNWNVGTFEWGYGGIKDPTIDISWAVDKNGNKVHLPGIDFVKVYVPTFVELGSLDLLTNSFKQAQDLNFAD